jgi:hypothetical protein
MNNIKRRLMSGKLYQNLRYVLKYKVSRNRINKTISFFKKNNLIVEEWDITINRILEQSLSLSRFGDGEYFCMSGFMNRKSSGLNTCNQLIRTRLIEVFKSNLDNLLIGVIPPPSLPYGTYNSQKNYYWNEYTYTLLFKGITRLFSFKKTYSDATIFLKTKDYNANSYYFSRLKEIWNNKHVIFVTSLGGRLDIDHNLFDNIEIKDLIAVPEENAFAEYDQIFSQCLKRSKSVLFLLSAGFTATLLAHDLAKQGYQAIDIGHITHNLDKSHA